MKTVFALAFVAVVLGVVSAKVTQCKTSDPCGNGECCAGFTPFDGKCSSLSTEGNKCLVDEIIYPYPFFDEVYIQFCPCADGLECVPTVKKGKTKDDGICQAPTTVAPTTEAPTSGDSGEVTKDGSDEVATNVPSEMTKDASGEVTNDAVDNEVSEAPVEESQRR